MKKKYVAYVMAVLGLIMFAAGLFLVRTLENPEGILRILPYVLIAVGCGIFGHIAGDFISQKTMKKYPDLQKQMEIAAKDERNLTIASRAKAKAYDRMLFVFGELMIAFLFLSVDTMPILLLIFAYLLTIGSYIYYQAKYEKEM